MSIGGNPLIAEPIHVDAGCRTLVFVPTYNEAGNVQALYREIEQLNLSPDYLFLDDNSPDGTGRIIDEMVAASPRVHTIHRTGKLGIGSAHADGIRWAHQRGYSKLVTMDCDFTHSPEYIPQLLSAADSCDISVGSRFIENDSLPGWVWLRRFLTRFAHVCTIWMLGMPYDATGAFRVYRLDRLNPDALKLVGSRGYSFFFESLYVYWLNGAAIREVPVRLPARAQGHSKMTVRDAWQSFSTLLSVWWRRTFRPASLRLSQEEFVATDGHR